MRAGSKQQAATMSQKAEQAAPSLITSASYCKHRRKLIAPMQILTDLAGTCDHEKQVGLFGLPLDTRMGHLPNTNQPVLIKILLDTATKP
jgi:hypothetical protein